MKPNKEPARESGICRQGEGTHGTRISFRNGRPSVISVYTIVPTAMTSNTMNSTFSDVIFAVASMLAALSSADFQSDRVQRRRRGTEGADAEHRYMRKKEAGKSWPCCCHVSWDSYRPSPDPQIESELLHNTADLINGPDWHRSP